MEKSLDQKQLSDIDLSPSHFSAEEKSAATEKAVLIKTV